MIEDYEMLLRITKTVYDREVAALARLTAEQERLSADIDALVVRRVDATEFSPADYVNIEKYAAWVTARKKALQIDLARLSADMEDQKRRLRKAFGKREAIAALCQQARDEAKARL